jgi:AcrR family transcriptional regulator
MNDIQCGSERVTTASVLERSRRAEIAKAVRKEEILGSARRVFAARGFRGTTMADVADEAGIALGTIYLYFASKEDVFAALNQQFNALIITAMTDVPDAVSLEQTVRLRVDNVFRACAENRDLVRLVVLNTDPDSAATERMRVADRERSGPMVAAISEAMAAGAIRAADPCIMTKLITGLVSIAVYQAFVLSDGRDADKYRTACGDMIVSYMAPPQT